MSVALFGHGTKLQRGNGAGDRVGDLGQPADRRDDVEHADAARDDLGQHGLEHDVVLAAHQAKLDLAAAVLAELLPVVGDPDEARLAEPRGRAVRHLVVELAADHEQEVGLLHRAGADGGEPLTLTIESEKGKPRTVVVTPAPISAVIQSRRTRPIP